MEKRKSISFFSGQRRRKWSKVIEPLTKYNRNINYMGYSLDFMFQLQKIVASGVKVKINLPLTLSGTHDNCLETVFQNEHQQIGTLNFISSTPKNIFEAKVQKFILNNLSMLKHKDKILKQFYFSKTQNTLDQTLPFTIIKQKLYTAPNLEEQNSFILNQDQYKKMVNIQTNQIAQAYVFGKSNHASLIRIFCFPKKQNCTHAYQINNYETFLDKKLNKNLWKIKKDNQYGFIYLKIMHENKCFYQQTINLVNTLESVKKINIDKIVCDWILDVSHRYWLSDVKQLNYSKKIQNNLIVQKKIAQVLSIITCSLCKLTFKTSQITKIVTNRLICDFFNHIRKRHITLSFATKNYKYTSQTCRICDLCFMLVVSESKLKHFQNKIAKATNSCIPFERQNKYNINSSLKQSKILNQWRLFLYIEDIKSAKFLQKQQKYFIMLRLHDNIISFEINNTNSCHYNSVKGIKVLYLFSQNQHISDFLSKTQINLRLTSKNNWNTVFAQGSTYGLYEQSQKYSMRKFKQILIFNQKSQYCVIGLHIGLKLDGVCDVSQLTLTPIFDMFISSEQYTNSHALPAQWMQIIDPSYCSNNNNVDKVQYQLNLTLKQSMQILPRIAGKKNKLII